MHELDYMKLINILQQSSSRIKLSPTTNTEDIEPYLDDFCRELRVARISVSKIIHGNNRQGTFGGETAVCYEKENYDPEKFYNPPVISSGFVDAQYSFYQFKDNEPFTENEKGFMDFLCFLIFSVAGNILLGKHLSFAKFHELRFKNVYNAAFLHTKLADFVEREVAGDFGILQYNIHGFSSANKKYGERIATEILEKYHNGLQELLGDNPDRDGFDVALGGDNGFVVFKKEAKDKLINYLCGTEIKFQNDKDNEESVTLTSRFGFNMELEGYNSPHIILSTAATALNIVRRTPGLKYIEYDEVFKKKFEMQRKIEGWYDDALEKEEFLVYYQPKVDLHNYSLTGAEALVRWVHNEIMVYPDQFIPVLENNLSIKQLDLYMPEPCLPGHQ